MSTSLKYKILVIEDDDIQQNALSKILASKYELTQVRSGEEGLKKIHNTFYDLVLLDIVLPGMNGIRVLEEIKKSDSDLLVIIITAYEKVSLIVDAMKLGIYDYLVKPLNLDELELTIEKALENMKLRKEVESLRAYQIEQSIPDKILGDSDAIKEVSDFVRMVTKSPDTSILIEGETGTGKELVAAAIHFHSCRRSKPFIKLNCAAIPRDLIESELFGYEKGSFTGSLKEGKVGKFELADSGTLLMDEVSELPLECQSKLLRVLEDKKFYRIGGNRETYVDVRIISSTNRNIDKLVEEKKFREDLYYRLNVARITIPPLRERKEDIIPLSKFFLVKYNQKFKKNFQSITPEAKRVLTNHPWKGNVRELRNVIEMAVLSGEGEMITSSILEGNFSVFSLQSSKEMNLPFRLPTEGIVLDQLIKNLVEQALEKTGGNKAHAARLLGISKPTLLYRLEKYGLKEEGTAVRDDVPEKNRKTPL